MTNKFVFDPQGVELIPARKELAKCRSLVNLIAGLIALLALGAAFYFLGCSGYLSLDPWWEEFWFYSLATAMVIVLAVWVWLMWLIPFQVANFAWAVTDDTIYVRSGKFFQTLEMMPLARLQFADSSSGPVERQWHLATVAINGAASEHLTIYGVTDTEAKELVERLRRYSKDNMAGL